MKKALLIIPAAVMIFCLLAGCDMRSNQPANIPDMSGFIGEERVKEIALERAGISANGVVFNRIELERDNGVWQYEIEFREARTEYDADIDATDGTVLKWEIDYDN